MKKKILIVDRHALIRDAISYFLSGNDYIIVGSLENGILAVDFCKKNKVDLVIMDVDMSKMNGVDASINILKNNSKQKILILTSNEDISLVKRVLSLGVNGFLNKDSRNDELILAINSILEDGYYLNEKKSKDLIDFLMKNDNQINPNGIFTQREIEVMKLICYQKTTIEIAEELFVSPRTVDGHKKNILMKIGAKNVVGMIIYAFKNNIVQMNVDY